MSQWYGATFFLSMLLQPLTPVRALRSTLSGTFSVLAPILWNCLPFHVRAAQYLNHYKTLLKTHFFSEMGLLILVKKESWIASAAYFIVFI